MKPWEEYEKETGKSCTQRIVIESCDVGTYFEKDTAFYVKWLEDKLQNTSSSSETECFYCCGNKRIRLKEYGKVCCPECKRTL